MQEMKTSLSNLALIGSHNDEKGKDGSETSSMKHVFQHTRERMKNVRLKQLRLIFSNPRRPEQVTEIVDEAQEPEPAPEVPPESKAAPVPPSKNTLSDIICIEDDDEEDESMILDFDTNEQ